VDVDALMDLPITACRDIFGRAVTYTPLNGAPVPLTAEHTDALDPRAPQFDSVENSLSFRAQDLADAGITPTAEGDSVTFSVLGISRTNKIVEVLPERAGSIILRLGIRS
jgi:hypothetical protein